METIKIGDRNITFQYNKNNIQIIHSYKIHDRIEMLRILSEIVNYIKENSGIVYKRQIPEWLDEWEAHNLFYDLNLQRERSESVDLNENEDKWKIKYAYPFCAFIYRAFGKGR